MAGRKRNLPNWVRREVCKRYGASPGRRIEVKCHYCDEIGRITWPEQYKHWPMLGHLEFDHYIPEHAGGASSPENLVLACRRCNRSKGRSVPSAPLVLAVDD